MAAPDAMDFFKDEVENESMSVSVSVSAVHRIKLVAAVLGHERLLNDLLPYLLEMSKSGKDELLHALAQELFSLTDFVSEKNYVLFLPILENLTKQEEPVVRDESIDCIKNICEKSSARNGKFAASVPVTEMVNRLAKGEWFTSRVSSCKLIPVIYQYAPSDDLLKLYISLTQDETPMVKRTAAVNLKDLVRHMEPSQIRNTELMNQFKKMSTDETQDQLRESCIWTALEIAKKLSLEDSALLSRATKDPSWRVRISLARAMPQFCQALGSSAQHLPQSYASLLDDTEVEVRTAAVLSVGKVVEFLSRQQVITHILPLLPPLVTDLFQSVRAALASVLGQVVKVVGKEQTQKHLISVIVELMTDHVHDVRLNIVSHAGELCEVLGNDAVLTHILTSIQGLFMDNQWRIRLCVVKQIPRLAKQLGQDLYQSKLESVYMSCFSDSVHAVREVTIETMQLLAQHFGSSWTVSRLVPKFVEMFNKTHSYSNRITTLHALPRLCPVMNPEEVIEHILPLLNAAYMDTVPNVRFVTVNVCGEVVKNTPSGITKPGAGSILVDAVKPIILELCNDADADVRYYSTLAAQKLNLSKKN
eukprot:GHVL01018061.1.p1 GENE.GHVL01018061.1~~GHVL01018061.1.p1  ORF type:complete len:590 (+),score=61.86 GHVL01018061.1:42-1811(+)